MLCAKCQEPIMFYNAGLSVHINFGPFTSIRQDKRNPYLTPQQRLPVRACRTPAGSQTYHVNNKKLLLPRQISKALLAKGDLDEAKKNQQ